MQLKDLIRFSCYPSILNLTSLNDKEETLNKGDELVIIPKEDILLLYASNGGRYSVEYQANFDEWINYDYLTASIIEIKEQELVCDIFGFAQYLTSDQKWQLGVDDKLVEQIQNNKKTKPYFGVDKQQIIEKLTAEFILDLVKEESNLNRMVAAYLEHQNNQVKNSFSIVGKKYIAKIQNKNNQFLIISITEHHHKTLSSLTLIEGEIQFIDETLAGQFINSHQVQAEFEQLDSDNSAYLNIWEEYSTIELQQITDKQEKAGILRYQKYDLIPIGEEAFDLHFLIHPEDIKKIDNFITTIESIEAYNENEGSKNKCIGLFKKIKDQSILVLSSQQKKPPQSGFLRLSLLGDKISHQRREDAHLAIKSSLNPMLQLRLILEGSGTTFSQRQQKSISDKAIKKAFGKQKPTKQQKAAVRLAIDTPDIALIQGPPGTGKTQVISAILKLLAERSKAESKRYVNLLTSYQHDAVDNAVERAEVFGLPAYRIGKKKGEEIDFNNEIHLWREKKQLAVQQNIDEINQPALYRQLNHVRELITLFQMSPSRLISISISKLNEIIVDIEKLNKAGLHSNPKILEALREKCFHLKKKTANLIDKELMRLIWALRITKRAYLDDGEKQFKQLFQYIEADKTLTQSTADLLNTLKNSAKSMNFNEMKTVKETLLDLFLPDRRSNEIYNQDNEINYLLQSILEDLNNRIKQIKIGKQDVLAEYANALQYSAFEIERLIRDYTSVMATTCQKASSNTVARELKNDISFENVIVDEAARANPLDLLIPLSVARKKIILVGDHRQLPHMLEPDIEKELITEMADDLTTDALKKSLFERLWLQQKEKGKGVTLNTQFRMHPVLGDLISKSFYEIENDGVLHSGKSASEFKHSITKYQNKCAIWLNCEEGKEAKRGFSRYNQLEAKKVAQEVLFLLENTDETIGVISFYAEQALLIKEYLKKQGVFKNQQNKTRLRIGTVDSFQGMEFGIVLLSTVRSNRFKCDNDQKSRFKFGHLTLANRLNVAMSRQQKILMVVGNKTMFDSDMAKKYTLGLYNFYQCCLGEYGYVN